MCVVVDVPSVLIILASGILKNCPFAVAVRADTPCLIQAVLL